MKEKPKYRSTHQPSKFLGLTTSEWVRLNCFLALVLLLAIGYVVLPSTIGN